MLNKESKILITGGHGMVGTALYTFLNKSGYKNVIRPSSKELDLRNQRQTERFFLNIRPKIVIIAAAKVGGIQENKLHPADFITENALIEINTIRSAVSIGVSRLLMISSSSIYPSAILEPTEEDLMNGSLDEANEGYSIAKLFGVQMSKMYRKQYGVDYSCIIPCNLYGKYDRFTGNNAHVIPAMISKFHNAKVNRLPKVEIWGTGRAMREFMYADDLAACCIKLINADGKLPLAVNIGSGNYVKISELADMIKNIVGYDGQIRYSADRPEGQFMRKMKLNKMHELGLDANTSILEGLKKTYEFYLDNIGSLR